MIRVLRLPRLVRYVRLLRPVIRFARLFIFFFRFTDRLVRRYADVFNRNIILFELKDRDAEERDAAPAPALPDPSALRAAGPRALRASSTPDQRLALADAVAGGAPAPGRREIPAAEWSERAEDEDRDIPVEEVVERLIEMTPEELVEQMGPAFVNSVDRYLRLFDVPIVRRLPVDPTRSSSTARRARPRPRRWRPTTSAT